MYLFHSIQSFLSLLSLGVLSFAHSGAIDAQDDIGDGGPATEAVLESPSGLAFDKNNNLFVAERRGNRIRRIDSQTGVIETVVGTGSRRFGGDGLKAIDADISIPELIAFDRHGDLLITDRGNGRIRKVDMSTGLIETVIGTGTRGYEGDGGQAKDATISSPFGVGVDPNNNIYFADTENHCIRKIDSETGIVSTIAGSGEAGFSGDGDLARNATLKRPHSFAFDPAGNLIIGDSFNLRIRVVDAKTQQIDTLYGIGKVGFSDDGTPAAEASFGFFGGFLITEENIFFSEFVNHRIRVIDRESGLIDSVKDSNGQPIEIEGPYGLAFDKNGSLFVASAEKNQVLKINLSSGEVSRVAGK